MGVTVIAWVHVKHVHATVERCTAKSMVELVGMFPFREDVNHFVLTSHWRHPRLGDPAEHAADSASGTSCGFVGGSQPSLAEASAIELAVVASNGPDIRPFVVVYQGVHVAVAVTCYSPTGLRTVVAVVADTLAGIKVSTDGIGTGATAHATVLLGDVFVGVVHQGVADVVDMYIVGFTAVVTVAGTFVGTDTDTLVEPSLVTFHVALIVQHFLNVGVHVSHALN